MTKIRILPLATAFAMTMAFQGLTISTAEAGILTACLTRGGDIKNIALGTEPTKPCGRNDTEISWNDDAAIDAAITNLQDQIDEINTPPDPSLCPCDIGAMAGWAGWAGPECSAIVSPEDGIVVVELTSTFDDETSLFPFTEVNSGQGEACHTFNDARDTVDSFENLSPEQIAACIADIDKLAISLGLVGGCAP